MESILSGKDISSSVQNAATSGMSSFLFSKLTKSLSKGLKNLSGILQFNTCADSSTGITSSNQLSNAISEVEDASGNLVNKNVKNKGDQFTEEMADQIEDELSGSVKKSAKEMQESALAAAKKKNFAKMTAQEKGNYGEMLMDEYFEGMGYQRVSKDRVTSLTDKTHQGIDGVYYNPKTGKYIIAEAKAGNSAKLSNTKRDGKQMSKTWIDKRIGDAVDDSFAQTVLNNGNYESVLFHLKNDGSISTSILNDAGNILFR